MINYMLLRASFATCGRKQYFTVMLMVRWQTVTLYDLPEPMRHNYPHVGVASSPTLFEASKLLLL